MNLWGQSLQKEKNRRAKLKPIKRLVYASLLLCIASLCTGCLKTSDNRVSENKTLNIEERKLPIRYDLREQRKMNSVEDQGRHGTCLSRA